MLRSQEDMVSKNGSWMLVWKVQSGVGGWLDGNGDAGAWDGCTALKVYWLEKLPLPEQLLAWLLAETGSTL